MDYVGVSCEQFAACEQVDDWRFILGAIRSDFVAGSFPAAASFIVAITEAAERAVHHPDIDLRYPGIVRVALTTHSEGGLTMHDVELAREISRLAATAGLVARPTTAQVTELAIDTVDAERIRPFWAAILDYREVDGQLIDPMRMGPSMWFQQTTELRLDRNRFHLDISVPHDVASERIVAAIAAGGTLVSDTHARAFWVIADADGNEACICTWQDRTSESDSDSDSDSE
jgi:4a-hydroxytetrahydrobiopterin dehydratase